MMVVTVRADAGVCPILARHVRNLCRWASEVLPVVHDVNFHIKEVPYLSYSNGKLTLGLFSCSEDGLATINLTGLTFHIQKEWEMTGNEARLELLYIAAHELVHYEQWRDGRPLKEQGVYNRAWAMVDAYLGLGKFKPSRN